MSLEKQLNIPWGKIAIALILALVSAEIIVRLFISSPSRQLFDAELGYRYKPNSWYFNGQEGGAYNRINNIGLFDDDLPVAGRSKNIAVLGDSFVESLQLPVKQNFMSLLEQRWPDVSVINGGQGAFNPSHYPYVLERILTKTEVDLTILFLHPGELNGLVNDSVDFVIDDSGAIVDITPKPNSDDGLKKLVEPLITRSAFFSHFFRQIKPVFDDTKDKIKALLTKKKHSSEPEATASTDIKTLIAEFGSERFSVILKKLNLLSNNNLLVVYFSEIGYGLNAKTTRYQTLNEGPVFEHAANSLGIPVFDLSSDLERYYHQTHQPPRGFHNLSLSDGHLNKAGHRVIADALENIIHSQFPELEVNQ